MERTQAGLTDAIERVRELKAQFWRSVAVTGENTELNQTLERAGRVADFFELAELMCIDALHREESCGCHYRVESQTADGEARRDDDRFAYVAAWEFGGADHPPVLHREDLEYRNVEMKQRSYK
jgi:succinate dehydrogenase / fumarate reductase flavoprotein subunit